MLHQSEGGIGKSMHKLTKDFSRGKVDLFLEPNTYQIFTQFSMFAFKGIFQASWLEYGHFPDSSLSIFTREIVRIIHTLVLLKALRQFAHALMVGIW